MRYVGINSLIPTLTACSAPLGMDNKSKVIKDAQISASSEWNGDHAAIQGRLNFLALMAMKTKNIAFNAQHNFLKTSVRCLCRTDSFALLFLFNRVLFLFTNKILNRLDSE